MRQMGNLEEEGGGGRPTLSKNEWEARPRNGCFASQSSRPLITIETIEGEPYDDRESFHPLSSHTHPHLALHEASRLKKSAHGL